MGQRPIWRVVLAPMITMVHVGARCIRRPVSCDASPSGVPRTNEQKRRFGFLLRAQRSSASPSCRGRALDADYRARSRSRSAADSRRSIVAQALNCPTARWRRNRRPAAHPLGRGASIAVTPGSTLMSSGARRPVSTASNTAAAMANTPDRRPRRPRPACRKSQRQRMPRDRARHTIVRRMAMLAGAFEHASDKARNPRGRWRGRAPPTWRASSAPPGRAPSPR